MWWEMCTGIMHDSSKLQRVFNSLEVFVLACGGRGVSPQTSVRQMLPPEGARSSTGDAFLSAAAAEAWSHDAFVAEHNKNKIHK